AGDLVKSALMRSGELNSAEMDKRYVRKDGSIVTCRLTVSCVRKTDKSIDYFVGIIQDITWRKQAEEELRKSEERFRSSLLYSPVPIMLFDDREKVLAVSRSWLEASGYSQEDLSTIEDWTARAYGERQRDMLEGIRWIISAGAEAPTNEQAVPTKNERGRPSTLVYSAIGNQAGR